MTIDECIQLMWIEEEDLTLNTEDNCFLREKKNTQNEIEETMKKGRG